MKRKDFYIKMMEHFSNKDNPSTKEKNNFYKQNAKQIEKLFDEKSGVFAENLCREEIESGGFNVTSKGIKIESLPKFLRKQEYKPDGLIEQLDMYIECKNYMFYSSGTANEKLPGFLIKLQHYDKPCLLILCGQHELRTFAECNIIRGCYNEEEEFKDEFLYPVITKLKKQKKLYVCGFLDLKNTLKEIKDDKDNS